MKTPLDISVLSIAVSSQLDRLGITLPSALRDKFDRLTEALATTFLHGVITDKAFKRGVKKLKKEIRHEVTKAIRQKP
ncbi:MAG: hypothetical protein ABIS50_11345 [Luteolibacter sp.]|uniref:hypothetical protein n=1 Tax=Luteolibacter sp. TaxID=1962973 RepID=UPI00326746B3